MPKKPKKMTLENLAAMVARGFDQTATKKDLELLATKKELEQGLSGVLELIDSMRVDVAYIRNSTKNLHLLERDVQDLQHRMLRLEKRVSLGR